MATQRKRTFSERLAEFEWSPRWPWEQDPRWLEPGATAPTQRPLPLPSAAWSAAASTPQPAPSAAQRHYEWDDAPEELRRVAAYRAPMLRHRLDPDLSEEMTNERLG